ncbi:hypothetical protein RvY_03412 [Ramazzottius varieornatus]|uniref:Uncharacterized protein n=1 Tax=Ramazzottius varieornatus TaxID=947166 RepID=A0A1D1UNS3_RAMVA|nr:hypothetical protein RvY_03412 [Ramazzottius varieornatus]
MTNEFAAKACHYCPTRSQRWTDDLDSEAPIAQNGTPRSRDDGWYSHDGARFRKLQGPARRPSVRHYVGRLATYQKMRQHPRRVHGSRAQCLYRD